ncbi:4-hydroxy-tetrahydrodipicolinate synthase [Halobacillus sp. Marseille-Q1614]|uniref:4-hydroxy-tetrahydrodipicolinate synthase n=1 Tax=Halobacillus sp. Marseille-Q1614 TaxID=2709134 RepID=UPI0015700746|nr:4-hydroxy-tetrahydrodipicolinate synthase [Halobacillus sp. Marseille-Q1614]
MDFGKVLTAMVTPFDSHGNIDFTKTSQLVEYLIDHGTDGLVIAGTTGESPTLTSEEKVALWEHVVQTVNGRIPVIAGTGSNNTKASIELSQKAVKTGVDAVMLVTPYYNKPSQQGLYEHFKAIAESINKPVMLYNIPGRSAVRMTVETVVELSKIENIVSVKEATADLDGIAAIIEHTYDDFSVYSGDDNLTLPIYAIGGNGVVSVSSHIAGLEMQKMLRLYDEGKGREAAQLHRKLLPVLKGMFIAPSPSPVKTALQMKGIDTGGVRLPLVPLNAEERLLIQALINKE